MQKERSAQGKLVLSMLIFGTIGLFRRYIPLPSGLLAMARGLIGTLFLVLVMALRRQRPSGAAIRKNLPLLILSGAMIGFNWILLFEAYNHTTVALATLCYYMAPVFVTLASAVLFQEHLTRRKLLCVAAALCGMVLVSGIGRQEAQGSLRGIALGLGAAVLYAGVVLLNKRLTAMPTYDKTIVQLGASALVLAPYVLWMERSWHTSCTPAAAALVLLVGVVHTGVAYALYFASVSHLKAQTIALLSYIDPASAIVLSALLLREPVSAAEICGVFLILGAAIASELPDRKTGLPQGQSG